MPGPAGARQRAPRSRPVRHPDRCVPGRPAARFRAGALRPGHCGGSERPGAAGGARPGALGARPGRRTLGRRDGRRDAARRGPDAGCRRPCICVAGLPQRPAEGRPAGAPRAAGAPRRGGCDPLGTHLSPRPSGFRPLRSCRDRATLRAPLAGRDLLLPRPSALEASAQRSQRQRSASVEVGLWADFAPPSSEGERSAGTRARAVSEREARLG